MAGRPPGVSPIALPGADFPEYPAKWQPGERNDRRDPASAAAPGGGSPFGTAAGGEPVCWDELLAFPMPFQAGPADAQRGLYPGG